MNPVRVEVTISDDKRRRSATDAFEFEVAYDCLCYLHCGLTWQLVYVSKEDNRWYEHLLMEVLVRPVHPGKHYLVLKAESPDRKPNYPTAYVMIKASYEHQEFFQMWSSIAFENEDARLTHRTLSLPRQLNFEVNWGSDKLRSQPTAGLESTTESTIESTTEHQAVVSISTTEMARLVNETVNMLENISGVAIETSLAAFLVSFGKHAWFKPGARVVALATGCACPGKELVRDDGFVVVDCHAEVLARRCFVRWLLFQMSNAVENSKCNDDEADKKDSVFEIVHGNQFQLKDGVHFHLYLSQIPCGDGSMRDRESKINKDCEGQLFDKIHKPSFKDPESGCLMAKGERGAKTVAVAKVPLAKAPVTDKEDDFRKYCTMSCSDKLLKWNILGIQGAAISNVLRPIYISNITFGNRYNHGRIVRALCCRVDQRLEMMLPQGYRINHPHADRVPINEKDLEIGSEQWCFNWSAADELPEIINGHTGQTADNSPYKDKFGSNSSICKHSIGKCFRELLGSMKHANLMECASYLDLKTSAIDYQEAKRSFYSWMRLHSLGVWMCQRSDLDNFPIR